MNLYKKIFFFFLVIESFFLFLFAPHYYLYEFDLFCLIQYVVTSFIFIKIQKKENYFDFDLLFLFTYFFVMFFYPVFLFPTLPKIFVVFEYEFNEDVISRCTALSLLGSQAYMFGSLLANEYKIKYTAVKNYVRVSTLPITFLSFISFVMFLVVAGPTFFTKTYGDEMGSSTYQYFLVLFQSIFFSALIIEIYNSLIHPENKKYKINKLLLSLAFIIIFLFLYSGSRTIPLQIVLMLMGVITVFKFKFSFFKFLLSAIMGVLAMFATVIMRGYEGANANDDGGLIQVVMDLIINNRNTFIAIDFADNQGFTYGKSMLSNVLSPVPFLQNIVFTTFGIKPNTGSSSLIISTITLNDDNPTWGLGTNIIADIYMAFGVVGVVLFMFILGYFIKRAYLKVKFEKNLYSLIYYAIMMSLAVFIVRAEYFFFLRLFLWCTLIVYIFRQYQISSNTKHISNI